MQTVMRKLIVIASLMLLLYGGLAAEELGVLKGYDGDVNDVVEIPNVNVYAIMQSGLLIGADNSGINNLSSKGYSVEYIGTRDFESSYFLFQSDSEGLRTFESTLDVFYTNENEVIARINEGQELRSNGILRNLTHISFTPKPVVDRSPVMPIGDLLTDP
ncbi:MAG: hypothetical protein GY855_02190, partial [candidate division Zixibacteria bacterium]|nr:hypothetical protein [candidate division Zixibacteria bacterium]